MLKAESFFLLFRETKHALEFDMLCAKTALYACCYHTCGNVVGFSISWGQLKVVGNIFTFGFDNISVPMLFIIIVIYQVLLLLINVK